MLAHAVQVAGDLVILATDFMMTVSGFVEAVSRAFFKKRRIANHNIGFPLGKNIQRLTY